MTTASLALGMYDKVVQMLHRVGWLPPFIARVALGWTFVESGYGKLTHLQKVVDYFQSLGIPGASIQAPFAAATELGCGILILIGLFTRLASIPLTIIMMVALLTAKRSDIHDLSDLFAAQEFLFIVLLLWLLIAGGGSLSIDRVLTRHRSSPRPT